MVDAALVAMDEQAGTGASLLCRFKSYLPYQVTNRPEGRVPYFSSGWGG